MEARNSAEHSLASCWGTWVLYALLATQKRLQQLQLEMLKALMKGLIFEMWSKTILWAWASKWEGVADITLARFELLLAEKRSEKKVHLCNSKLCCLGHLQGLLAVLSIPWYPCHESSWELSRNTVLGDVKKIEVFSSHLPQASSLASPHKCIASLCSSLTDPFPVQVDCQNKKRNQNQNKTHQPWRNGF